MQFNPIKNIVWFDLKTIKQFKFTIYLKIHFIYLGKIEELLVFLLIIQVLVCSMLAYNLEKYYCKYKNKRIILYCLI